MTFVDTCLHWLKATDSLQLNHVIIGRAIILPAFATTHHAIGNIPIYEHFVTQFVTS